MISGALGATVVVGFLATSAPAPEPSSQVIAAATAPRAPAAPSPVSDDNSWTEEDLKHCAAVAKEAGDAAAVRMLLAVSADRVGLGGPSETIVERSAYLLCSATRKPRHLCQSYWQKQFIDAIKVHAQDFRKISSQMYWTNYNVAERARRNSASDKADWEGVTDDLRQTTRETARMHEEIVTAFRALIADGIIRPDDFGAFFGLGIPPEITELIGEARPIRQLCS